jgi:hypothetical protein
MNPTQHPSNNAVLGAPAEWDQQGMPCSALPITRLEVSGQPTLASFWRPEPEELAALNAGGLVMLMVHSNAHPVVSVGVVQS